MAGGAGGSPSNTAYPDSISVRLAAGLNSTQWVGRCLLSGLWMETKASPSIAIVASATARAAAEQQWRVSGRWRTARVGPRLFFLSFSHHPWVPARQGELLPSSLPGWQSWAAHLLASSMSQHLPTRIRAPLSHPCALGSTGKRSGQRPPQGEPSQHDSAQSLAQCSCWSSC